jgi:GntR family transcriptional regulator
LARNIRAFAYSRSRDAAYPRILGAMDLDRSVPVWPQVADELRRRLDAGTYPPGSRFPAVVDLAAELDVAASTVQKAVAALRAEGRLRTVLGQGSFVAD